MQQDDPDRVIDYLKAHPQLMEGSRQTAKDYLQRAADSLEDSPMNKNVRSLLQRITVKLTAQV